MEAPRFNSSNYVRGVKTRRTILLSVLGFAIAGVVALTFTFSGKLLSSYNQSSGGLASKRNVLSLWKEGRYQEAYDSCLVSLSKRPLDSFFLLYGGFSAFHAGISRIDDEEKRTLLEASIASIRKARLRRSAPLQAESSYVLGKAYYHLGYYRLDQSVDQLEAARARAYSPVDLDEYLGMAYFNLGRLELSIQAFSRAMSSNVTDQLCIAMANALRASGKTEEALEYLKRSIEITTDVLTKEKAHTTMAGILLEEKRLDEAQEQYSSVLEGNSESAEAHYGLGLVHEARGDLVQARAEWRKAVKIEPMHQASRMKLTQK